ncbi:MAG: type I restriction-modification system subunit M [Microcoleaceae cyanobacterium]
MAIKKTELYTSLWASCDELRGGMDASQYKDYILTLLFMKYVSDKYEGQADAMIEIPSGCAFGDIAALQGNSNIGEEINQIITNLAEANDLQGVINVADFNDEDKLGKGKEMVDRLSKLVAIFNGLNLGSNRADGDDLLGDAYEYLMRHFATQSGKSKGQFYTPAEVSRVVAKVVGINPKTPQDKTVYDPTCGSGSLLLKVNDEASNGLTLYGQEKDNATWALARMNTILHNNETAEIEKGNTLASPGFKQNNNSLKTFDFAVANPPFSFKAWSSGINPDNDEYQRFEYGIPPAKNGDFAFLLHILTSLNSTGKAAVILPHGVLFRGNAEATIRKNLVKQGYIKGIIGLPANLFYGTGIPACIIVIDKAKADSRNSLFMIDASKGFVKDGNKNRLRSQDIHKIVDVFNHQLELPRYSRNVSFDEIAANDYNLNIPRYIDSSETEDIHDLNAHLNGGIPNADIDALESYWRVFTQLRNVLFTPGKRSGYSESLVEASQVKATILNHPEFTEFAQRTLKLYYQWRDHHAQQLTTIRPEDKPKQIIVTLSEDLLQRFAAAELLDKYDIYQILMNYWAETLQDDIYILIQEGWTATNLLRLMEVKKGEKPKETPDLIIGKQKYKADLIPPRLIISRYFPDKQEHINQLQADLDAITQELEAVIEEHNGEDGALSDAQTDAGKVTKTSVTTRLKAIKNEPDAEEELTVLQQCLKLFEQETALKKAVKDAQTALDKAVFKQYPKLTSEEIKTLVIDDKWFTTLEIQITAEIERVTQQLANRVKTLEERYAETLPQIEQEVIALSSKVEEHLKQMGYQWGE